MPYMDIFKTDNQEHWEKRNAILWIGVKIFQPLNNLGPYRWINSHFFKSVLEDGHQPSIGGFHILITRIPVSIQGENW